MKIIRIEQQKRNKNRYSLYHEGGYFMSASAYVVHKQGIEEGKDYSEEDLKRWAFEDDIEKAKGYTADYLIGKTEHQIRTKLKEKGYEEEVVQAVFAFLHRYKYVDDQKVAKALTNDSLRIKREGQNKIKQKMFQKGIKKEDMEAVLGSIDEKEEREAARYQLEKNKHKYKAKAKNSYDWRSKCYQMLLRKGFPYSIAESVIGEENWEL